MFIINYLYCLSFHVKHCNFLVVPRFTTYFKLVSNAAKNYRPIITSSTLISLGLTPGIRLACANVSGFIFSSFWRPSVEISNISE